MTELKNPTKASIYFIITCIYAFADILGESEMNHTITFYVFLIMGISYGVVLLCTDTAEMMDKAAIIGMVLLFAIGMTLHQAESLGRFAEFVVATWLFVVSLRELGYYEWAKEQKENKAKRKTEEGAKIGRDKEN